MENLSLFLQLVKNNTFIYSIITSGSFSIAEQKSPDHYVWGDNAIELKNFKLSDNDEFSSVLITSSELGLHLFFRTEDPKYFTNTRYYFNEDTTVKEHDPYAMNDTPVNHNSKNMGVFNEFNPPLKVSLHKSSVYGFSINLYVINKEGVDSLMLRSFEQDD